MKNLIQNTLFLLSSFLFISSDLNAQDSELYLEKGIDAFYNRNYDEAIDYFDQGIKHRDVWIFNHYFWKASCLSEQKDYKKAKEAYEICLKINIENPNHNWIKGKTYWNMGRLFGVQDQYGKEIGYYKKSLTYKEDPHLYNNLGFAYIKIDSFELGLENLSKCLELDPTNAYGFNNRAWLLLKMERYDEAKIDLDKSKESFSKNPHLHRNYGMYFIGKGDLENACKSLKEAQELGYFKKADEGEKYDVQNLIKEHCLELGIRQ